jgi:uncharacterized repeat protein (TIGR03803 family)
MSMRKSLVSWLLDRSSKAGERSRRGSIVCNAVARCGVEMLESRRMLSVSYLHSFVGTDGVNPSGGLVMDSSGNLFGIASTAASNTDGEIYEMENGSGGFTYRTLYTFTFADSSTAGYGPKGRLVLDSSGNLYGTTDSGGANGEGNIFEITRASINGTPSASTLYSFGSATGGADGTFPEYGLAISTTGTLTLYGTTTTGGNNPMNIEGGDGVVFKYVPSTNTYTVLHAFQSNHQLSSDNGANPSSTVTMDGSGNLFCTTQFSSSGTGYGELYEISGTTASPLFDFGDDGPLGANPGFVDGRNPLGNLSVDSGGNVYGTTEEAGPTFNGSTGANNFGTVYRIDSSTGHFADVWGFPTPTGSGNWNPEGGLVIDSVGNIFGTTREGGSDGVGDIFKIDQSTGVLTELDAFSSSGPNTPVGTDLVYDSSGNLYGTTLVGSQSPVNTGDGTVFEEPSVATPHLPPSPHAAKTGIAAFSNQPIDTQVASTSPAIFETSNDWSQDSTDVFAGAAAS